eukprot:scaffold6298_cov138-Skeletonema_marinoi.AAC.1
MPFGVGSLGSHSVSANQNRRTGPLTRDRPTAGVPRTRKREQAQNTDVLIPAYRKMLHFFYREPRRLKLQTKEATFMKHSRRELCRTLTKQEVNNCTSVSQECLVGIT